MKHVFTAALLLLVLQGAPGILLAAPDDPPTTATLMAQAGDPAVIAPAAAATNVAQEQPAEDIFTPEQLEQLVAPIALYPDALLMQILMASTYPLEIVEADRWISKQPDLKGDALDKALLDKDWDPSVKSLTTLPSVLTQMSDNLDWTQDLGDAFLAQQNDLMDTVQIMRGKAYDSGNLQTTEQQQVTQNPDKIIVIQQASPEVVYVPTYSPTVVYGPTWGYPSYYYPAMYPYYPPGYGLLAFGVGVAVGGAIWGGANWGWGNNDVNIDIDRHNEFNRNTNNNFNGDRGQGDRGQGNRGQGNRGQGGKESWQHDASHRKGVDYKSKDVAQRNGASAGSNRVTKDQARGRSTSPTASNRAGAGGQAQNRATGAGGGQAQNRAAGAGTGAQAQNRAGAGTQAQNRSAGSQGTRPSSANRSQSAGSSAYRQSGSSGANSNRSSGGNSAFSGSRTPSSDRMSSSRGASSRGTSSYGGSRGGGGGGRAAAAEGGDSNEITNYMLISGML